MLRTLVIFFFCTLHVALLSANDPKSKFTRAEYIGMWKDVAMHQMREHGIPASITLAQAILESGDGNSRLARDGNNHFGIKCHDWTGKKIYHDDDARGECFRKYGNARESFEDHSIFLKRSRYAFLFDYEVTDYKSWAKGLKQAGYATNPKYPELLIRIIEENNLTVYDKAAIDKGVKQQTAVNKTNQKQGKGDEIVINLGTTSSVFVSDNRIKYILAERNETPESIAKKLNMTPRQIRTYNDLEKNETISKGSRIYMQPKRNRAAKAEIHVVKQGETLRGISQYYGVKINKLAKRSGIADPSKIKPGDKIVLR